MQQRQQQQEEVVGKTGSSWWNKKDRSEGMMVRMVGATTHTDDDGWEAEKIPSRAIGTQVRPSVEQNKDVVNDDGGRKTQTKPPETWPSHTTWPRWEMKVRIDGCVCEWCASKNVPNNALPLYISRQRSQLRNNMLKHHTAGMDETFPMHFS